MFTPLRPEPLMKTHRIESISILCNRNPALLEFLFHHKALKLRLSTPKLLEESREFDQTDRYLIQASIDLWNRTAHTDLTGMLAYWDPTSAWIWFIRALCHLKEIRQDVISELTQDEEQGTVR